MTNLMFKFCFFRYVFSLCVWLQFVRQILFASHQDLVICLWRKLHTNSNAQMTANQPIWCYGWTMLIEHNLSSSPLKRFACSRLHLGIKSSESNFSIKPSPSNLEVLSSSSGHIVYPSGREILIMLSLFKFTEQVQYPKNQIIARQAIDSPGILSPVGKCVFNWATMICDRHTRSPVEITDLISRALQQLIVFFSSPEPAIHGHMWILHLQCIQRVSTRF